MNSKENLSVNTYHIFPGIDVSYNQFQGEHFPHRHDHQSSIMEVNHCRRGRMGWQMAHNLNLYLGEGDLSFHMTDACSHSSLALPLGYYEGIAFTFDFDAIKKNPPDILKNAKVDYDKIQTLFCDTKKITTIPQSFDIDCIFNGLYNLPEDMVVPYCKLKVQEFLLYLSNLPSDTVSDLEPCDSEQVTIVKEVHEFLTENLQERYTIDYLSKKFLLNTSTLKSTFKAIYGAPIAKYMKEYRMNKAVLYLRETDHTMAEIALAVGYENQSKFSAAFKDVIGVLPTTFRKNL